MRIPFLLFSIICFSLGCQETRKECHGDIVRIGRDSFEVKLEKHHVTASDFIRPVSVLDGINPKYQTTLENGQSFSSARQYIIGEEITFKIYVRIPQLPANHN